MLNYLKANHNKTYGTFIGAIAALIVVGARVLFVLNYYGPVRDTMFGLSPTELFFEYPLFWMIFGLPFGGIIGLITAVVFDHLDIVGWRIVNLAFGAILGFGIPIVILIVMWLLLVINIVFNSFFGRSDSDGQIWAMVVFVGMGLTDFLIPGAMIGAVVGLLLRGYTR
jgi:hypothetical protein